MESKKILIIAGVGATLGVVGYLYFKKKKPTVSETQIKSLNENTISEIQSELLSPETKPQTVSGSTLGATFSNAQTVVQNENVTVKQSSEVVSQLLDMVQQEKAEALFGELKIIFAQSQTWTAKYRTGNPDAINKTKRNCAIIKEINNLGYELVGLTNATGSTNTYCSFSNLGTLRKIQV